MLLCLCTKALLTIYMLKRPSSVPIVGLQMMLYCRCQVKCALNVFASFSGFISSNWIDLQLLFHMQLPIGPCISFVEGQ